MKYLKPEYQEQPVSRLTSLVPSTGPLLWAWQGFGGDSIFPLPQTRGFLLRNGWKLTPHRLWVETQLYETLFFFDGVFTESWYRSHPDESEEPPPVVLTFTLEHHPLAPSFRCLNPLPPPTMGEYGLVHHHDQSHLYHIRALSPEMQQHWQALGDALKALSAPFMDWQLFPDWGGSGMIEHELSVTRAAGAQSQALRQMIGKEDWGEQWQKIQRMARQLARGYYYHHLAQPIHPLAFPEAARRRRPQPYVPVAFDEQGYAPIVSSLPMQAVINAIHNAASSADRWLISEDAASPVPYFVYRKSAGTTIVSYRYDPEIAGSESAIAHQLWQEIKTLDEKANDLILDIFSHLSLRLQDGAAWFFAADHLDRRNLVPVMSADRSGRKKRRAGHRQEDIQAVADTLQRLENIWLTIDQYIEVKETTQRGKKRRKKTRYTHEGRFLIIDARWYRDEVAAEEKDGYLRQKERTAIGWHIRAGEWLRTFLEVPNRQVALLCKVILAYDPYRQMWEKRLARYLLFHSHMHCHGRGGVLKRTIRSMIEEVSLPLDRANPARTRDRFERAVDQLTRDKLIDGWHYENEPPLPAKNWLNLWLDYKIWFVIAPSLPTTT